MSDQPTRDEVFRWLRHTVEPDTVVELRILNAVDNPEYPPFTLSGYFHHGRLDDLADAVLKWTARADGCYITINPALPDLLARASNRVVRKPKHTTNDSEIVRRVGLVFDADPVRPAGVSATEAEKAAARTVIDRLVSELARRGWPPPILADSGNGYHARYGIDLPSDDGGLVERVLKAAAQFSSDLANIDTSLFNSSRIIKLYGSMSRKGDHTDERPHRWSKILDVPADFRAVPTDLLESFAAELQPAPPPEAARPVSRGFVATARGGAGPEERARAYVFSSGFPDSIAGQKGHGALYRCASELVDGFGLDRNQALPILREWNQAKARPPESEKQVQHKLDDAIKNHPRPSLRRLNADRSGGSPRPGPSAGTVVLPPDPPIALPEWPAAPAPAAYGGLAGEIVRTIEPESEADPVALLVQLLIAYGNAVGRHAHVRVGAARHHTNEFAVLVGETSAGRKGTSWSDARQSVAGADPEWSNGRILGGLSSGEGLIYHVRDPIEGQMPIKEKGRIVDYQTAISDPGVNDKRLLVFESEFGGVLKALDRDGNKLSAVIRQAWDGDLLASLTKGSPYRATGAHISIIGHITADELTRLLTLCDQANGFANRMLWVCCRRSKLLPYGGSLAQHDADRLKARVADAIAFARDIDAIGWTRDAMDLWESSYPSLTAPRPGVFGMVTSRAEAHAVRLALLYALLDRSSEIEPDHLQAALALWDYCERSARYIFGDALGDRDAQAILDALGAAPAGLTRTEISRGVFNGHKGAETIASKLGMLLQRGLVRSETADTEGRPAERWFAAANRERSEVCAESPPAAAPSCASFASFAVRNGESAAPGREVIEL